MSDKRLAAAFFIPQEGDEGDDLVALATAAGLVPHGPLVNERGRGILYGCWDGIDSVAATLEGMGHHVVLQLTFWVSEFFDGVGKREWGDDLSLERDPIAPRASTFLATAERLGADVAILTTHLYQADIEFFRDQYIYVVGMISAALVNQRYGLLYMKDHIAEDIPNELVEDRDVLQGEHGLLVFAGRGATRWF